MIGLLLCHSWVEGMLLYQNIGDVVFVHPRGLWQEATQVPLFSSQLGRKD